MYLGNAFKDVFHLLEKTKMIIDLSLWLTKANKATCTKINNFCFVILDACEPCEGQVSDKAINTFYVETKQIWERFLFYLFIHLIFFIPHTQLIIDLTVLRLY